MQLSRMFSTVAILAILCSAPLASNAQQAKLAIAHAQEMVKFISPGPGAQIKDGTTTVSLRLDGSADPSTLKIVANGKDVTEQFHTATCAV